MPLVCLILPHLWTAYCLCFLSANTRFFSTPLEGSSPPLTLCFLPPKPRYIILPYLRIIPGENETDFILIKTNSYRNAAYHFLIPVHHNPCCFGSSYTVSSPSSFKCGRFSAEKMVSKEQCPGKSCCVNHSIPPAIMVALVAESVL